ncbi:hypothetical protein ACHAWF_015236 [Thalassiosira exigua]
MAAAHGLPRSSHRTSLLLAVGREFGAGRRLLEELGPPLARSSSPGEGGRAGGAAADPAADSDEVRAFRRFLGAEAPPPWSCDPSVPSVPRNVARRARGPRVALARRLRRLLARDWDRDRSRRGRTDDARRSREAPGTDGAEAKAGEDQDAGPNGEPKAELNVDNHEFQLVEASTDNSTKVENDITAINADEDGKCPMALEPYIKNGETEQVGPGEKAGLGSAAAANDETTKPATSLLARLPKMRDPGGPDKCAEVVHESDVDPSNVALALASLAARPGRRRDLAASREIERRRREAVLSYLELAEELARPPDANFCRRCGGDRPQSAPLAVAVAATQSYLSVPCNNPAYATGWEACRGRDGRGDAGTSSWEAKGGVGSGDDDGDEGGEPRTTEEAKLLAMRRAAEDIAKRGKADLANPHLASFARIRLAVGVAVVAEALTPRAAEAISRPCAPASSGDRTPFDLVRRALVALEEDGDLISSPGSAREAKGKVVDEALVRSLREAAAVFRGCVERDPEDVDHWSWYVATLFGMLCVAHRMECFEAIRNNASVAMTDFIKFTTSHDCPMFHLSVATMLEWKRAVFLLRCLQSSCAKNNEFGLEVRRLHAHHASRLAAIVEMRGQKWPQFCLAPSDDTLCSVAFS